MYLREMAAAVGAHAEELGALMAQESGRPLCESIDCAERAAAVFAYFGREDTRNDERAADTAALVGVVGAIIPFDFPLLRMALTVAPAIARGCTIVCQAPRQNPLSILRFASTYQLLPAGVVNVLAGGADSGAALAAHPDVAILRRGSPASCESIIVRRDADLDIAVPDVAWSRLRNCGQNCTPSTRIFVDRSLAAAFADRLHEYIAFLEVGDPLKRITDLGPLISHDAVVRVGDQVAYAVKAGARLKLGGLRFRPWGLPGHFFQPTILTDVTPGQSGGARGYVGPRACDHPHRRRRRGNRLRERRQ